MLELKPFGKKAHDFAFRPPEKLAFINILSGAIRSSKTTACIPRIFAACAIKKPGHKLISGVSKSTIKNNILGDVFDIAGKENYTYNAQSGELTLFGSKFIVTGAKDEGSEKYIRGLTLHWALVDEAVLIPESFWLMLVGRLSVVGSTLIATTNPGSPASWLYRDWVADQEKIRSGDVFVQHFTLYDNPNLDPEVIKRYERMYRGVWFRRMIKGEWCPASGAIWGDVLTDDLLYDPWEEPEGLKSPGGFVQRFVLIDVGTHNPFVAIDTYDDGSVWWAADEYRWDSQKEYRQKSNSEYADDIEKFIGPARNAICVIDPSALSFKVELELRGIPYMDAVNDVYQGILKTSTVMATKKIRFNRVKCAEGIKEMQSYMWDPKKSARGVEEPIKAADHYCDGIRYGIATVFDDWRLAA